MNKKKSCRANPTESEVLRHWFRTDDLLARYGTDDPVEIFARKDEVSLEPCRGITGFEDDFEETNKLIHAAKRECAKREKSKLAGSLDYLAAKLGKSTRQVREYCKRGKVPGAFSTSGGHWRIRYDERTVNAVRDAISADSRQRTDSWFLKLLRAKFENDPPPSPEETGVPENIASRLPIAKRLYYQAALNLIRPGNRITGAAVAREAGRSRTTVRKYFPNAAQAGRQMDLANSAMVDQHIDAINAKKNGRVKPKSSEDSEIDSESLLRRRMPGRNRK